MKNRATIFIPVVTPNDKLPQHNNDTAVRVEGRFIEVYADSYRSEGDISDLPAEKATIRREQASYDRKAIDKYWDRVSAPLRKNSPTLYQSGSVAANALRKIHFKHPWFALFQHLKPKAIIESKRLHAVSAWGPTEGHSAELGLALALASSICGKDNLVIIATGALSSSDQPSNGNAIFRFNDIKVQAVGAVAEKLRLVILEIENGVFQELVLNQQLLLITPKLCSHAGLEQEVKELAEVKTLTRLGLKVVPVDWLSEALSAINADTTHYLAIDRAIQITLGLIILFILTIGSWLIWREAEIPMSFMSANPGHIDAEPFELCAKNQKHYALAINKKMLTPTLPIQGIIGWKTIIGKQHSIDANLANSIGFKGYYIAVVVVSEFSTATFAYAKMGNTTQDLRIMPGQNFEGWIKLNDQAETNALIILAQRQPQFDVNALREQYQQRFSLSPESNASNKPQDINAAIDFIKSLAPGSLVFPFVTVMESSKCMH